ncbi:ATP-binding cassette domain-containing protein [Bradyrhizobium sp. USDA 336]|uniref:ATP-binding cassette domain-containing protein n=1 Tax=Bradyrhizobium sp. USDA 336 TaxID=3156311 RepID=UPI0038374575
MITASIYHSAIGPQQERSREVIRVSDLSVSFRSKSSVTRAVRRLSFHLSAGETLAMVGESGSGKSASALAIMGLLPRATTDVTGSAMLNGETNLLAIPDRLLRTLRGGRISMIFQEPMTALNPLMTIGDQIVEAIRLHLTISKSASRALALDMLAEVGLSDPKRAFGSFPHQLSGGMRQRAMIAMAVAPHPSVLIADEPTTALDVTVQLRVLELLDRLKREFNLGILLVTHDLGVVAHFADRAVVMLDGQKVEEGPVRHVLREPQHSYTRSLLEAVPRLKSAAVGKSVSARAVNCSVAACSPPNSA